MKKHLLTAVLAIVAIGGVFAMKAEPNKGSKTLSNQTVYYAALVGVGCEATECSDNPARPACTANDDITYDDNTCTLISDFKYLRELD